ncbi:MAG TPA: class I SAM-dependent methyltransferase [Candidatus Polarisedimenticolia bacterium]|nr:class I SAM-dependent methyltransferase [Candidatus Polarisedimenticolia bacterium]
MKTPDDVKARVSSAYHSAADHYDHAGNSFWDRFGRRTVERLGVRPGERVLDLCCGSGASALPAAVAAGPAGRVVGVDLAPGLLDLATAKAQRLGLANVEFRRADILALDDAQEAFDAVICVFGIFFVPDMAQALRAMWSYARPGGRVAVTTWGAGVFEPVNSSFWEAIRRVRPELFKSFNAWDRLGEPRLLDRLFEEAGLRRPEIAVEAASHPLPTDDDALALILGTGYRGVVDRLSTSEWARVREDVLAPVRSTSARAVKADVIYAMIRK